jgi:acyl-CoA thioester hydrolase
MSTPQGMHGAGDGAPRPVAYESVSALRVRYAETDQMGVVYHANYLVWCEIGRTDFIRTMGTPYAELERQGTLLAVSDAALRFRASARYDDPVRVRTRLVELRSRALRFAYRIEHAEQGTVLVTAETTLVALDAAGRLAVLPSALRDLLQGVVAPERWDVR